MPSMEREPVFIARGYRGRVVVYDHGVEVHSFGVFGTEKQHISYDQLAQVVIRPRTFVAALIIESRGGGTLTVKNIPKGNAEQACGLIRELSNQTNQTMPPNITEPSVPSQIRELADLKEAGLITQAEFETSKKKLLDSM
jgi:hypothetical protein